NPVSMLGKYSKYEGRRCWPVLALAFRRKESPRCGPSCLGLDRFALRERTARSSQTHRLRSPSEGESVAIMSNSPPVGRAVPRLLSWACVLVTYNCSSTSTPQRLLHTAKYLLASALAKIIKHDAGGPNGRVGEEESRWRYREIGASVRQPHS